MIGAHPDDEDTDLLAWLSLGRGIEAAYLSLSRGEGGQNLIGSELGMRLGLLRSQELAAARDLDGAGQFFTRAYDFGYSRSLEETERHWHPDSILKDVVRVVRRFRPHVIVSVWSGTPRDRHGHHTMAGVIARRAYERSGNPEVFSELLDEEGLRPWTPLKLYRSARFDSAAATLSIPVGEIAPRVGKTYHQIAMESRSQHRSQNFGVLQRIGQRMTRWALVESRVPALPDADLLDGVPPDTSWVARMADSLRHMVPVRDPAAAVPALAAAIGRLSGLVGERRPQDPEVYARVRSLGTALMTAAGIVVDAVASRSEVVPGETFDVEVTVYNGGSHRGAIGLLELDFPEGWGVERPHMGAPPRLPPGSVFTRKFKVTAPLDAMASQPYFLQERLEGALYQWSGAPELRGLPFGPPPLVALVGVAFPGLDRVWGRTSREVTYRFADRAIGEMRKPVRVVPAIEARLTPDRLVWSSEGPRERAFTVTLNHNGRDSVAGDVSLEIHGWPSPPIQTFAFTHSGEVRNFTFSVTRPAGFVRGGVRVRAVARTIDGRQFNRAVEVVDYPHVRSTPYVREAVSEVNVAPIALPALGIVGYVRGASDRVPEALAELGLEIELLDEAVLARGDLSRYGAIVIGSRAYERDAALVRHNDRLLEYVYSGGHLIVQYQRYGFARGAYAPYTLEISFPHDRITDETAPVRLLRPDHPVFTRPHRIGPDDWEQWPQERGLYFAGSWDSAYAPLLEMTDPGMPPMHGGLLVARYGRGTYVYTGLSFFRALPAGVAGAYRLFVNLLALGERVR